MTGSCLETWSASGAVLVRYDGWLSAAYRTSSDVAEPRERARLQNRPLRENALSDEGRGPRVASGTYWSCRALAKRSRRPGHTQVRARLRFPGREGGCP